MIQTFCGSLIMDPSRIFFLFIPPLVKLLIAGDVRFVDAATEFLSFVRDISQKWSIFALFFLSSAFGARFPERERRNTREYERNISMSDFRAKKYDQPVITAVTRR